MPLLQHSLKASFPHKTAVCNIQSVFVKQQRTCRLKLNAMLASIACKLLLMGSWSRSRRRGALLLSLESIIKKLKPGCSLTEGASNSDRSEVDSRPLLDVFWSSRPFSRASAKLHMLEKALLQTSSLLSSMEDGKASRLKAVAQALRTSTFVAA